MVSVGRGTQRGVLRHCCLPRSPAALSVADRLALGSAALNSARFGPGQGRAFFSMAFAWAIAMLCCLTMPFLTGRYRTD